MLLFTLRHFQLQIPHYSTALFTKLMKRKITSLLQFLIILVFTTQLSAQTVFDWTQDLQNTDAIETCDAVLTLNNNNGSLSNQTKVLTICPEVGTTELEFFSWSLNTSFVSFTIYDGDTTNAPVIFNFEDNTVVPFGVINTSESNTSGCITLEVVAGFIPSIINIGFGLEIRCAFECPALELTKFVVGNENCIEDDNETPSFSPNGNVNFFYSFTGASEDFISNLERTAFLNGEEIPSSNPINLNQGIGSYELVLQASFNGICEYEFIYNYSIIVDDLFLSDVNDLFTLEELISDVFITGNCANVGNISSPNNASLHAQGFESIGYFEAGCSGFPFENGIVIGSGGLAPITTSMQQNGNNSWPGDQTLTLVANGGIGNGITRNATIIEFEFSSYEEQISFNYIFASNEYPNFVCQYADPFAFIISGPGIDDENTYNFDGNPATPLVDLDLGGLNIANIPDVNGNLVPITVPNIHNNTTCSPNSFGFVSYPQFYSGPAPYHNIAGETVVMTAVANVIPCETYTLKLMVSDWQDTLMDSYVFLDGGSFDLGANLGDDILFTDEEPIFEGQVVTLEPFDEDFILDDRCDLSIEWFKDGVLIEGANDLTLDVTEGGLYEIFLGGDANLAGCSTTDQILVEIIPVPNTEAIGNMFDLLACQPTTEQVSFDLTINKEIALSEQDNNNFNVTFHMSEDDAINKTNPIVNNQNYFVNTSLLENENQVIWIRIEEALSGLGLSFEISSFQLGIANPSVPDTIETIQACNEFTGNENFLFEVNLANISNQILAQNTSDSYFITYHFSEAEALSNENAIENLDSLQLNAQINELFVRVTTISSPDCFEVSSFFVESYVNPEINTLDNLENCKSISLDIPVFDLSQITPTSVGTPEPSITNLSFFFTEAEALANENPIVSDIANFEIPGDLDEITLFVRLENNEDNGNCFVVESFNLSHRIFDYPQIIEEIEECRTADDVAYNFSLQLEALSSVANQYNIEFYSSEADAIEADATKELTATNALDLYPIVLNSASNITMRISFNDDPNCYQLETFTYTVYEQAVIGNLEDFEACGDFENETVFDFSSVTDQLSNLSTTTNFEVSYFDNEVDAQNNSNPLIEDPSSYELLLGEFERTIFVRVENPFNEDCSSIASFNLIVFPTEIILPEEALDVITFCPQSVTESANTVVSFTNAIDIFLGENQSLATHAIHFYTNEDDAINATNELQVINNIALDEGTNTFYIRIEHLNNPSCFVIDSVTFEFNPFPEINLNPSNIEICLENDLETVNLTDIEGEINAANLSNFTYTYFVSSNNPDEQGEEILNPSAYQISESQTIEVEVLNTLTECSYVASLEILVYNTLLLNEGSNLLGCDVSGIDMFDLTEIEEELLANVSNQNLQIDYYLTLSDAENDVNPIADVFNFQNTANPQTIFVVVTPLNEDFECGSITSFDLVVNSDDPLCESLSIDTFTQGISIYPNPTTSIINLQNSSNITVESVRIININGQRLSEFKLQNVNSKLHQFNVSELASGIYFIEVKSQNGQKTVHKFIKQ